MTSRDLITKNIVLRTTYEGKRRTKSRYSRFLGENIATFLSQYHQILRVTCDSLIGGWCFQIMLDRETLFSILNCLDVGGLRLPVIVTGRKP